MAVIVSLLRGVNVGGHNMIKMDSLRKLYESLGLHDVQTYVQSGNVVFRTNEKNLIQLSKRIEEAIERSFGFRPGVIVRTAAELAGVIARNPFSTRKDIHPGKLLVIFLGESLDSKAQDEIGRIKAGAEEVCIDGRELYIYFPDGMGRSKLPALLEKTLKKSGTGRNWNSVTRLLEMARKLE